jgi:hypothetical protein
MNVTTVAKGLYAAYSAYQPNTNNKIGGFNEVLQEQLQKSQEPSPVLPQESGPILYDLSSGQAVEMKFWLPDIDSDPGLRLYVAQLATELGITKNDLFTSNFKMPEDMKATHFYHPDLCSPNFKTQEHGSIRPIKLFYNAIQELLDAGLISKKDIIDKVKHQPEYIICEDGAGGCVTKLNYEGYEDIEPTLVFSSASELFEIIWGKEKSAS